MALTKADPTLLEPQPYQIVWLTPQAEIERVKRWTALLSEYPPPQGVNDTTRKVWAALLDAPRPMTSRQLADMFRRHRGNIDRALTTLRDADLVRTTSQGLHAAQPEHCRR